MPNRILKESICTSSSIEALTWFEEVLFYRLIVTVDDYGRFDGRAAVLKGRMFPLDSVTVKQVEDALDKLSSLGMIHRYTVDSESYLEIKAWARHQTIRNQKSKYPGPEEADDPELNSIEFNCMQMNSDVPVIQSNPIQSESESNPNRSDELFEKFWKMYPKKVKKKDTLKIWKRMKLDNDLFDKIMSALDKQKKQPQWTKDNGQFIPNPSTWLNGRRWEDETITGPTKAGSSSPDFEEREYSDDYFEQFYNYALNADLDDIVNPKRKDKTDE